SRLRGIIADSSLILPTRECWSGTPDSLQWEPSGFSLPCRRGKAKMRVVFLVPFPSPNMKSDNPSPAESDPEQNISELLVHASELAKRVERLPGGPLKTKLRIALAEIDAQFDELKSSKD